MFDFLSTLEIVANRLIPLDPVAEHRLTILEGKSISVAVSDTSLSATLLFCENSIAIFEGFDPSATTTIQGPLKKIISLALFRTESPVQQGVRIKGDQSLLIELEKLFNDLDIHWEEPLSRYTGNVIAHQVGTVSRKLFHWIKNSASTLKQNTEDYINYELPLTIRRQELNTFLENVDDTYAATEKLMTRVAQLENLGERP